jgi:membrane protein YdbS with pleckstrin-like domain
MLMVMDKEELPAKIEKWMDETPPVKRFAVVILLILFLVAFMIWYWDWANLSSDGMMSAFILNIFVFFLIFMPLSWLWKKMKSN